MKITLILVICIAAALAQVVPDLPVAFQADAKVTMPFFGSQPGTIYYDYLNGRVRYDLKSPFGNAISIERYDLAQPQKFDIAGGQCQVSDLQGSMNPMSIPPFASFAGMQTINGQDCQYWTLNFFGITLNWWVSNSTDSDGKISYQTVRFSEDAIGTQIDFGKATVGPIDDKIFDVSVYGCVKPKPPVTYNVAGYAKNAINNKVIANVKISLKEKGLSTTTDSNGLYKFSGLPAGNFTLTADIDGYFSTTKTILIVDDSIQAGTTADLLLSPKMNEGQWRVILTWAAFPRDLDAHMKTPSGCEVNFRTRSCTSINLDIDQRQGFGPETITIDKLLGTYTYYVYNWSNEKPYTASNGRVQVYNSKGLVSDIQVPTSGYDATNRFWLGFTIDQSGSLNILNKVVPSV